MSKKTGNFAHGLTFHERSFRESVAQPVGRCTVKVRCQVQLAGVAQCVRCCGQALFDDLVQALARADGAPVRLIELRFARSWVPEVGTEQVSRISMMRKYVCGHASVTAGAQPVPTLTEHCIGLRLPGKGEQQAPGYLAFVAQVLAELESNQGQSYLPPLSPLSVARYGLARSGPESLCERCTGRDGEHQFQTAEEMAVVRQTYRAVKRRILQ